MERFHWNRKGMVLDEHGAYVDFQHHIAALEALTLDLTSAKEEIERYKREYVHQSLLLDEQDKLTAERKETERLREALATVGELARDATNHSSCDDCTVERKMESVHEYIAAALQEWQGEA